MRVGEGEGVGERGVGEGGSGIVEGGDEVGMGVVLIIHL